jgi:acetylornithine aminotransferase
MLGTTFGGNHLACAAGIAVLDIINNEKLVQNAETVGKYFINELNALNFDVKIRGKGLMIGLEFPFPVQELRESLLFNHKIFTGVSGTNMIRLLPSLKINAAQADEFIKAFAEAFSDYKNIGNYEETTNEK